MAQPPSPPCLFAFATQGAGGDDEARLRELLSEFPEVEWFAFDRSSKRRSLLALTRALFRTKADLIVMEGTGIGGGLPLLLARLAGRRYVVSSGDAVGPFVAAVRPLFGPAFALYERALFRFAAGFVGWTPYLAGRALTFGCRRAMTAPGWAPFRPTVEERAAARAEVRAALGIPSEAIVFGIVGSLAWNRRVRYCYGKELVDAMRFVSRTDVHALIVGDGPGRGILEETIRSEGSNRFRLTGRVPREEVPRYLAAMDVASLPQSLDGVGSFRYTTKISEYLAAGLPIVTGRLPFAYDLDGLGVRRISGDKPWEDRYTRSLAALMESITVETIDELRRGVDPSSPIFDRERQIRRVTAFLSELKD